MESKIERYKQKRKKVNLDIAKEEAIHVLEHANLKSWSLAYKETVRLLFLLNQELDDEILEGKICEPMITEELEVM